MKKTKTSDTLPIVRSKVKALLTSSQAFQSLPPDKRREIANNTVKVTNYLVSDASSGADKFVAEVDFPNFVASLLKGVFDAIVDYSIRQMKAYARLVAGVAKSLDEFTDENISDNEGRDYLTNRLPHFFQSSTKPKRRVVRLASSRQQVLATMVLMGINRIVVTNGRIPAKITK